jgi:mono/diheme cytochrome c family protein
MRTKRVVVLALASGVVAAILVGARTEGAAPESSESPGKATYTRYCSACHGRDGSGAGPVATWLTAKPTDLTQLAKNNGGEFPMMKVIQSIDGSATVRAHGDSDMPVWGDRFRADLGSSIARQAQTRGKILLIADYLRTIQVR